MKSADTLYLESSQKIERRSASKTDRKFTAEYCANDIPHCISVNIDWLSFSIISEIEKPEENQTVYWKSEDMVFEYLERGTSNFLYSYKIYIGGEYVANIHTHPRSNKILKPNTCKVEILNHVLYSSSWYNIVLDILNATKGEIKNISRLDISYDGCNGIEKLLNAYAKQLPEHRFIWMKGKANFDAKRLDKKAMMFQNFRIGSCKKEIVVYEKQQELKHSNKDYIKRVWELNGLDTTVSQWRCELRMRSETIREIKDFSIEKCLSAHYLLSIFRTQTKKFFEFVKKKNIKTNISRVEIIDIFQFKKIKTSLLEKVPRLRVSGIYKAKLSLHNAIKDIIQNRYDTSEIDHVLHHTRLILDNYNLWNYYIKKKEEWIKLYQPINPNKARAELHNLIKQTNN